VRIGLWVVDLSPEGGGTAGAVALIAFFVFAPVALGLLWRWRDHRHDD
jgi:hypothetical protein